MTIYFEGIRNALVGRTGTVTTLFILARIALTYVRGKNNWVMRECGPLAPTEFGYFLFILLKCILKVNRKCWTRRGYIFTIKWPESRAYYIWRCFILLQQRVHDLALSAVCMPIPPLPSGWMLDRGQTRVGDPAAGLFGPARPFGVGVPDSAVTGDGDRLNEKYR